MIVIDILVWLLLIVAGLVTLLLLMPLHFGVEGAVDEDDGVWWHVRVAWAFGFLAVHADERGVVLRLVGIRVARMRGGDEPKKAQAKKAKKKKAKKKDGGRGVFWFLRNRRLLLAVLLRYVRALHLRGAIEGVVGLPDPDQTATLFGVLQVLDARLPEGVLRVEVEWVEEVVALSARLRGWVWPLQVVAISLALFIDRKSWRALRAT